MIYFIPGWYADGAWREQEQYWHARRMHTEFDDIMKHIQLFHRNHICPFQVILLSFAPNFRHFLHRQATFHAPYWSCFDAIQGVTRRKMTPLSFRNLKWPADTEFVYSMFVVLARRQGKNFAKVEFGEDGNMIEVEMYAEGKTTRKNIYDDRGFVSSTIVYQDGEPHHEDYLGEDGVWCIRHVFLDGHVEINPKRPSFRLEWISGPVMMPYRRARYSSMGSLIQEVLEAYTARGGEEDVFCAAYHPLHMDLLRDVFSGKNLVLSLFEERNDFHLQEDDIQRLTMAGQLICDSIQGQKVLLEHGNGRLPPCTVITPFDTRPDFGISQQMNMQKILVPVDQLEQELLEQLIVELGHYLQKNQRAEVYLFTREAAYGLDQELLLRVKDLLEAVGIPWESPEEEAEGVRDEDGVLLPPSGMESRWFAQQCVDELSVTKCLRMQRILVDFRNVRDVYLHVVTISMGIPQIVRKPSEFVEDGKNGVIIREISELSHWLDFYLGELANWNQAMVAAYALGKRFDTASQVMKWKGVLDSFERHTSVVSGEQAGSSAELPT